MGKSLVRCLYGCLFVSAALAQTSWIEEYANESGLANQTCPVKQFEACRQHLLRLRELLDGRADVTYRLARVEAAMGNTDAAMKALEAFSESGLTFARPSADPELAMLRDKPGFPAIAAREESARRAITHSTAVHSLAERDLVSEDIAYDPKTRRFFVSSVRKGKIVAIDANGRASDFVAAGQANIWSVMALTVDAKRRVLWATTASMPEFQGYKAGEDGRSAVLEYSLESGKLLSRFDAKEPGKHALADMTLSPAGDVYVSDGFYGAVYRIDHTRRQLELLVRPGTFRSPQTPALSPDQRRLFVADYTRGIGIVDLQTQAVTLLKHDAGISLGGIDGLYLTGSTLIAVQNGTTPQRVIQMTLDGPLDRIAGWTTLEANWEGLGQPTHGVVVGKDFYFLANSGWDRLDNNGKVKDGAVFGAPEIRRMAIGK